MRRFFLFVLLAGSWVRAQTPIEDDWDALYIGNGKVGYSHTVITKVQENGQELIQVHVESDVNMQRFGQTAGMKSNQNSFETSTGKVVRLDNQTDMGAQVVRVKGTLVGNEMRLVMSTSGMDVPQSIPWGDDILGPYAQSAIVRKHLSTTGDAFQIRMFLPDANRVTTMKVNVGPLEETPMLEGTRKLRHLESDMDVLPGVKTISWVDDSGDAIKTFTDVVGGMSTYRVTKDVALAEPTKVAHDFGLSTMVKMDKPIPHAFERPEIVYRIRVDGDDAEKLFAQDEHQKFSRNAKGDLLLSVHRVAADAPPSSPQSAGPEFLKPNNYLQSNDPKIVAIAAEITKSESDPWKRALKMEVWVHDHIQKKNYSTGFATAAEVAQNLEGDCTEHSVLLAALARAAGIPSRVATGFLYVEAENAFGGHMWTEVFVNQKWIPLDATLGRGPVGGTHIKVADSSLDGVDAMLSFFPILRIVNKVHIEAVDAPL